MQCVFFFFVFKLKVDPVINVDVLKTPKARILKTRRKKINKIIILSF